VGVLPCVLPGARSGCGGAVVTGHLTLARGLAVLCLLVLVGVCVSPFFYGWHVVAAWVFLAVVLGVLAVTEDRAAQAHRRRMRQKHIANSKLPGGFMVPRIYASIDSASVNLTPLFKERSHA